MIKIDRLSPFNIAGTLRRSDLYREVRRGSQDWPVYEVQPDEVLRPELIAYRHYGTDALKWVVLVVAGLDDMREALESGVSLALPPKAWVRERIRAYAEMS